MNEDHEFWISVCEGLDESKRFVDQTKTGETGNCMSACLASLFSCPISEVPNFYEIAGNDAGPWWDAVRDWLRPRGFGIISLALNDTEWLKNTDGLFIVSGNSERGLFHATIWKNGQIIHDPHPSKTGIVKAETMDLIYPLDPSKLKIIE